MKKRFGTPKSERRAKAYAKEVLEKIPGSFVRNESVTTTSIYMKTPDGFSLRVGDHHGKEKYKYKYNLGPQHSPWGRWELDDHTWRFYTSSVDSIAAVVRRNLENQNQGSGSGCLAGTAGNN